MKTDDEEWMAKKKKSIKVFRMRDEHTKKTKRDERLEEARDFLVRNFPYQFFSINFLAHLKKRGGGGKEILTSYRYPPFVRKSSLHRLRLILLSFHKMHSNEMTISYDA